MFQLGLFFIFLFFHRARALETSRKGLECAGVMVDYRDGRMPSSSGLQRETRPRAEQSWLKLNGLEVALKEFPLRNTLNLIGYNISYSL